MVGVGVRGAGSGLGLAVQAEVLDVGRRRAVQGKRAVRGHVSYLDDLYGFEPLLLF